MVPVVSVVLTVSSKYWYLQPSKSGCRKRGVEFKGGQYLALLLLVLENTVPRDDRDGFDGFGGFGGCGGCGRDGYPP